MITVSQVAQRLAEKTQRTLNHLFPDGQAANGRWQITHDQLTFDVPLHGPNAGQWHDQNGHARDLLDLWYITRKISLAEALFEAKRWLGIQENGLLNPAKINSIDIDLSHYPMLISQPETLEVFCQQTALSEATVCHYQLRANKDWVILPYFQQGVVKQSKGWKATAYHYQLKRQTSLFGWQHIPLDSRTLILTLSEIDTLSLHQLGFDSLAIPVSEENLPSLTWLADEFNALYFDKIILAWRESPSTLSLTRTLQERLGSFRCYQLKLPYDSINHGLQAGLTAEALQTLIDQATTTDPNELRAADDFTEEVLKLLETQDMQQHYQAPWHKSHGRIAFRQRELSIWTGINGHGKSQLLGILMLQFMQQGARVCIASLELKPERVLLRLNRQLLATSQLQQESIQEAQQWYQDRLWLFNLVGSTKCERILDVFEYARRRYGIDVFVIDSIMKCGLHEDDYNAQKQFVEQLCDFKNQHPCHIHLVAHPRKSQDETHLPNKMDIKGTGSMTDLADNVFSVWRNKNKEADEADAVLQCDKQRNGEWEGKVKLWFDLPSCHYLETSDSRPKSLLSTALKVLN